MNDIQFIEGYLERIDLPLIPSVDPDSLLLLQTNQLRHVPYENLDIMAGNVPLSLDEDDLWDKIVVRERGGMAHELNTLFAAVLEKIGFRVRRMAGHHPLMGGSEYDHLFLLVDFPEREESWIADVGFEDNNLAPVRFSLGTWQSDLRDLLRIDTLGHGVFDLVRRTLTGEDVMYEFNLTPHRVSQYQQRCDYFATSDTSPLNKQPLVSIDSIGGRMTLTSTELTHHVEGVDHVTRITSLEQWDHVLASEFGIRLDQPTLDRVHARIDAPWAR